MYFYLMFAVFVAFLDERRLPYALLCWAIGVSVGKVFFNPPDPSGNTAFDLITNPLTLEFILGCFIGILIRMNRVRFGLPALVIGVASFLVLLFVLHASPVQTVTYHNWRRVLLFGFPSALIVYGLVSVEHAYRWVLPRWLLRVGDASYSIYLSHLLVLSAIGRIWARFPIPGRMDNLMVLPLMIVAVIVWGFVSYRLIEFPLIRKTRSLLQHPQARI